MADLFSDYTTPAEAAGPYEGSAGRLPYQRHSATSRAAAREAEAGAATDEGQVLAYLRSILPAGATDAQIRKATGLGENSYRARRIRLVERGLVRDSGTTRENPESKKRAVVWVATAEGGA